VGVRENIPIAPTLANSPTQLTSGTHTRSLKPPVFIVGSPRSGTTLLYHMLLSSGGFAIYLTESKVFDLVFPQFGDLSARRNRRKALDLWSQSKLFVLSGLNRSEIEDKILNDCRNGGDFLSIIMDQVAHDQHATRWAENTPEHVLHLARIKKEIPNALIIHVIRDGRDVALSLEKAGWVAPFPWDSRRRLQVAGLYWEWLLSNGMKYQNSLARDCLEVRYEKLILQPRETLAQIGRFIDHDLDYERIQRTAIGSVAKPNTSFENASSSEAFDPVDRWRKAFPPGELAALEELIGPTLRKLGYPLATYRPSGGRNGTWKGMRTAYRVYWNLKLWLKSKTALGRIFVKAGPADL
jgi:Sulfotransferase family